jgi:hypothetical protein
LRFNGNNSSDYAPVLHAGSSASVMTGQPTDPVLRSNNSQAAVIDNEAMDHSKSDGTKVQVNSENHKSNAATTCEGRNSSCDNIPRRASKPRMPAANDALATGQAPLGRPDAFLGMTSAASSASSEAALEQSTARRSEEAVVDQVNSNWLMNKKQQKIAPNQNRPRQGAPNYREEPSRIGRGYNRPAAELDRAYALDRSYGSRGFWDWSG